MQLGGQTPLALARRLSDAGFNILGTSTNAIDRAEDRGRCKAMIDKLGLRQPPSGITLSQDEAYVIAERIGYPVLIRPSYVLGGRAMQVVYDQRGLRDYLKDEVKTAPDHPLLIDSFLSDAIEVDVDALSDGQQVMVVGIMQHVEEAGIHSGDSCCSLPPYSLSAKIQARLRQQTEALALELGVVGLINVQFAIRNEDIFVLEVNPRASRTVPFVAKAMGISVCRIAMHLMLGERLRDLLGSISAPKLYAVKAPVFPFIKFPGVDPLLGPEMKSTGEVMGLDVTFAGAFARAQMASGNRLPNSGRVFVSVRDEDKEGIVHIVKDLIARGFELAATAGTAQVLREYGFTVETVNKVAEGTPHVVDRLRAGAYQLVINTTSGDAKIIRESYSIRRTTIELGIPYFTTLAAARAAVGAMNNELVNMAQVNSLQEWHSPQTSR